MRRTSLAIALVLAACGRDVPPPSPPTAVASTTADASAPPAASASAQPKQNEVVRRIISGGDLFVRLQGSCESVAIEAGRTPEQRSLEVVASGPLGCGKPREKVAIDVTDQTRMSALACEEGEQPTPTLTPSTNEAVVDGAHLFADRAACEAATFTASTSPSCMARVFTAAVKNRKDEVPSGDFVTRFDTLVADPQAEVWHRAPVQGKPCEPYRIVRIDSGLKITREWTEKGSAFADEATWDYEPKCKVWMPKGTRFSKKTGGLGMGSSTRPASNIRPTPLAAPEHEPDALPFRPAAWFYTRRACEHSPR